MIEAEQLSWNVADAKQSEPSGSGMSGVWVSHAMIDQSARVTPLANDLEDQLAIDALNRNDSGEPLPQSMFPTSIWAVEGRRLDNLPELFWANAFWIASARTAEVLQGSDLGAGSLYPVLLLQNDRATPVSGEYFCLNFGNVKDVFLPERSPGADQNPFNPAIWYPEVQLNDDDIAVSTTALEGPDIWISPPLKRAFFVSDKLAKALERAKVARPFRLRRCRVV